MARRIDAVDHARAVVGHVVHDCLHGRLALVDVEDGALLVDHAVYLGIDKLKEAKYERKALLIISDGGDNRSRYTQGELRRVVRESDVQIYSIGIFDTYASTTEEELGPVLLSDISEMTGGRMFKVSDIAYEMLKEQPGLRPAPYLASRGMKWIQHFAKPGLSDAGLRDYIRQSHAIVSQGLSKKKRIALGLAPGAK